MLIQMLSDMGIPAVLTFIHMGSKIVASQVIVPMRAMPILDAMLRIISGITRVIPISPEIDAAECFCVHDGIKTLDLSECLPIPKPLGNRALALGDQGAALMRRDTEVARVCEGSPWYASNEQATDKVRSKTDGPLVYSRSYPYLIPSVDPSIASVSGRVSRPET